MKIKTVALLLALVLVVGVAAGGTLAWLTASTDKLENTFTTSDVKIELKETTTEYKMIPGYTIAKDPKATVLAGSEACWLFVKIEKSANFDRYLTYKTAPGWTAGDGVKIPSDIIYRKVTTAEIGTPFSVLENDQVAVLATVTEAMMKEAETNKPTLTFTAYASQLMKNNTEEFTDVEAWDNVPKK